jgi:glutamine synthetase
MPGSSQSVSGPNIALNTIMAEELGQFADELEKAEDFQSALHNLIRRTFTNHQRIIFNGNGYDGAWIQEAERRGLANLVSTVDALPMYSSPKNVDLFVKHGIYTKEEMTARAEIHIENYSTIISIEANTMIDMIRHDILPAVSEFADDLCQRAFHKESMNVSCKYDLSTAREMGRLTDALMAACDKLEKDMSRKPVETMDAMVFCHDVIIPDMKKAREIADELETITAAKNWPFPVYSELLFSV